MNELPEPEQLVADPAFSALKARVVSQTGLAYFNSREADLAARLRRRMLATSVPSCAAYLELLRDPREGEQDALVHELTIGETHFFRFAEQFEALRRIVIPALIQQNRDHRRLRIWSAGCSIGAEVYSLSILLERDFGTQLHDWSVSIVGTDIDLEYLERARAGIYAEWALRGLPDTLRKECFTETADGWLLDRRYARGTTFVQHNLVQDPLPPTEMGSDLDLILCRNVMIYFDEPTIRHVVSGLSRSLAPHGWLLVGHAEGNSEVFQLLVAHYVEGAVLFQNALRSDSPVVRTPFSFPSEPVSPERLGASGNDSPVAALQTWQPYPLEEPNPGPVPVAARLVASIGIPDGLEEIRTLADQGAWAAANERLQRVLKTEPLNPQMHFYQGLVFAQSGRLTEAEASLRRALFLEPNLPLAYYHLGLLLVARGARTEALRAFRNTLRAVESSEGEAPVPGSDLTLSRLREATLLQIEGVQR